jgi:MoxR-like ATPase
MDQQRTTVTAYPDDAAAVDGLAAAYKKLTSEIGKVIVGQHEVVRFVLISVFCDGHSLLVGVPGWRKPCW